MFERIKITPNLILKRFFGYSKFREGQLEIINNILAKKDTLAILPTGGGKSICFQIPALIFGQNKKNASITIVISPLISLMKDQVDALNKKGIPAYYINSTLSKKRQRKIETQISSKETKIIYIAPERLKSKKFISIIEKIQIAMIVVDEAHCISQWSNDFRPRYKQISDFYKFIETKDHKVVKVALTATATQKVQKDICDNLKMHKPLIFCKSFARKNLNLEVIKCKSEVIKNLILLRIINQHRNQTGIIYCSTKKTTENLSDFLHKYKINATYYHASITKTQKEKIQNSFINGEIKLIIATNAFGMGIDKNDVRFVIHYQIPGSIENYYQEIGRAGRDNKLSNCYCLYYRDDIKIQVSLARGSKINLNKLKQIHQFLQTKTCRTNFILKYFGETKKSNCNNCDNCSKHNNQKTLQHPLLLKTNKAEINLIRKLLKQKYSYTRPTNFLTDIEICYLSITKPKTKIDCMKIPGLGIGWVNSWWKIVNLIINSKNDKIHDVFQEQYKLKRII